jgi:hypothetical protein
MLTAKSGSVPPIAVTVRQKETVLPRIKLAELGITEKNYVYRYCTGRVWGKIIYNLRRSPEND